MNNQHTTPIYRPMLWRALQTAWAHKELWPFALLAGLAGTGVVINDLVQQASIAFTPSVSVSALFGGDALTFFQQYLRLVIGSGTTHLPLSILSILAVMIGGLFLVTLCQQLLFVAIHRAVHQKTRLTGRALLQSLHHHHFLRMLGVDMLFHVVIYLVLGGGGLLLRNFPAFAFSEIFAIALAAAILFVSFVLNVIFMLTLIAVGEEHVSITDGIIEGVMRFLRHPLVSCEVALLVFAANLVMTVGYLFGLAIISIPFGLLFAEALSRSSLFLMIALAFFGTLAAVMFTVLSAGFMTTFTYAMWTLLADYLDRAPFASRFHSHTRRLFSRK